MAILFRVKRDLSILFFVKRDLDLPLSGCLLSCTATNETLFREIYHTKEQRKFKPVSDAVLLTSRIELRFWADLNYL